MKRIFLPAILSVLLLSGCDFIKNSFSVKNKTEALVETLIKEDYDGIFVHFAMDHELAKDADADAMKSALKQVRDSLVSNFGTELNFQFAGSEKSWSTEKEKKQIPNTTVGYVEISNNEHFGMFKLLVDDTSGKILHVTLMDMKEPIPGLALFWLFGLTALCVPAFNLYVIVRVAKSTMKKKWVKYLAIILLNVPAIRYTALGAFTVKLLNFQILLGISVMHMGYAGSYWSFGVPLGGLYWLWRLSVRNRQHQKGEVLISSAQVVSDSDTLDDHMIGN